MQQKMPGSMPQWSVICMYVGDCI